MSPSPSFISKTLATTLLRRTSAASSSHHRSIATVPSSAAAAAADTPSTSSQPLEKPKVWGWSRLLLFIPGVATFGLGTWQLFRREEKIKMLEYRQNRLASEPINGKELASPGEDLEFRRVVCKGLFDEKRSIYIGPRSRSISGVTENGYYVITPLVPVLDNPDRPNCITTLLFDHLVRAASPSNSNKSALLPPTTTYLHTLSKNTTTAGTPPERGMGSIDIWICW